jgi:DNA-binding GntR family transcriptional regulator
VGVVNLLPVERRVLRHEVLAGLRNGILGGDIAPGTRLLEVPLANELGVSRGPVREALRQLEQEGLVEFYPHRGAVVVGVAEVEVETIYGIRALLEGRAFARACRVVTDDDLTALAETVERMVAASESGDVAAVTEYDLRFHGRVVEISGFQYLRRLWASIDGVVRARTARSASRPELADPIEARDWLIGPSIEHRELVDALRSRRPALAARAATAHVTRGLERLRADASR